MQFDDRCKKAVHALFSVAVARTHSSSNIMDTPTHPVPPVGSKGGDTSTRSAPIKLSPASLRTMR